MVGDVKEYTHMLALKCIHELIADIVKWPQRVLFYLKP